MDTVHEVTIPLGVLTAGTHLLWQAPTDAQGGGLTVLGAALTGISGTLTVQLMTMSNAGTPAINGTITSAAFGGTIATGVPFNATITDPWVDGGEWVSMITSATAVLGDFVSLRYTMGR